MNAKKIELALAAIVDQEVTREEQVLNLCSENSHVPLRNGNLPHGVNINMLHLLMQRSFIRSHPIERDANGSIVEYQLHGNGEARLRELRSERKSPVSNLTMKTEQEYKQQVIAISTEERNAKVLAVLLTSDKPIGPTEIARRINEPWCKSNDYFQSSAIVPVLRRIGAVGCGGRYSSPEAQ